MSKQVKHVDFGIPDARSYYASIVVPNVSAFEQSPTLVFAINAIQALWHIHEWHWYDFHPGEGTQNNTVYRDFRYQLIHDCPELGYLRDLSEATKHCGLGRSPLPVKGFTSLSGRGGTGGWDMPNGGYGVGSLAYGHGSEQLLIDFDDGSERCWLGDITEIVQEFWRSKLAV